MDPQPPTPSKIEESRSDRSRQFGPVGRPALAMAGKAKGPAVSGGPFYVRWLRGTAHCYS